MLLGVVDSRFNMSDHSEASKFSRTSDLCPGGSLEEQRYFFKLFNLISSNTRYFFSLTVTKLYFSGLDGRLEGNFVTDCS